MIIAVVFLFATAWLSSMVALDWLKINITASFFISVGIGLLAIAFVAYIRLEWSF